MHASRLLFFLSMLISLNYLQGEDLRLATDREEKRKWKIKVSIGSLTNDSGAESLLGNLSAGTRELSNLVFKRVGREYLSEEWVCLSGEANTLAKIKSKTGDTIHLLQLSESVLLMDLTLHAPNGDAVFKLGKMPIEIVAPKKLAALKTANPNLSVVVKRNELALAVGLAGNFVVKAQSQEILENLQWSITPLGGVEATWPADQPAGSAIKVSSTAKWELADLPESSSQYSGPPSEDGVRGELKVMLKATNNANLTIQPGEVTWYAFFDPLRKDHEIDGRAVPNWYYYWRKENPDGITQMSSNPADPFYIEPVDSYTGENERSKPALGLTSSKHFARQSRQPLVEIKGINILKSPLPYPFKFPKTGPETSISTLKVRSCSWSIGTRTDLLNVTACHEATHRLLDKTILAEFGGDPAADANQDGVPDAWAIALGLQVGGDPIKIPEVEFNGSDGGVVEFIAFIGAAFNADFGTIKLTPEFTMEKYKDMGFIPRSTVSSLDWSENGYNYISLENELKKKK